MTSIETCVHKLQMLLTIGELYGMEWGNFLPSAQSEEKSLLKVYPKWSMSRGGRRGQLTQRNGVFPVKMMTSSYFDNHVESMAFASSL